MLTGSQRHYFDAGALISTVLAGITLAQTALFLTCIATAITIILGGIRIYDRVRYGPLGDNAVAKQLKRTFKEAFDEQLQKEAKSPQPPPPEDFDGLLEKIK